MSEVKGFRTAFFIDTDARRCAPKSPQHWRANVGRPSYWAKAVLLWATLGLVAALVDRKTARAQLVLLCTLVFVLRVQNQVIWILSLIHI